MGTGIGALSILRVGLIALGLLSVAWGCYDLFGDSGAQTSVGVKKVIGGIFFAILAAFIMTGIINDVKKASSEAGIELTSFKQSYSISTGIQHTKKDNVLIG